MIRSPVSIRIAFALPLCIAVSVLAVLPLEPQSKPAKPVPDPALIDQKGFRELVERYRGKPLLVNFWATWCEPCREEYPMVNELARQYMPQGLAVVGISLDDDGEITLVRRFLARHAPVFPNYRKRPGNEEAFIKAVNPRWSGAIPATFFYSRDGREVAHFIGEHSREEFDRTIRALLEPAPKPAPASDTRGRKSAP